MLTIDKLNKAYGRKPVLKELSASFADGLVHGIIGLNGAGKTTFFNCLCGLLEYDGTITYDRPGSLKNKIGYVPTEPYFFPRITGKEYLEFIRHAKREKSMPADVLSLFDLPLNEYIENYSTGMKRKLAFQGAMIGESEIYILDEPFNGVDIKSNFLIKNQVLRLKEEGKTVLLSSHIISSLTEICDEIHLLTDGTIARHYLPGTYARVEQDMMEL